MKLTTIATTLTVSVLMQQHFSLDPVGSLFLKKTVF